MICPTCGYENQEGAKFCGKCGNALSSQKESPIPKPDVEQPSAEELLTAGSSPAASDVVQTAIPQPEKQADMPVHAGRTIRKKNIKTGQIVLAVMAVLCLAGGFLGGRRLAPKKYPVTREFHYDTYTLSMAAGFTYDGVSDSGTLEILGPQGEALGQIAGVRDGSFRLLDRYGKVIYLDKEGRLCEQKVPKGEKNILAEHGDWDSVWVSEDNSYMIYSEQVENLTETMIYDMETAKPKRLTDGTVKQPYLDVTDRSLYYLDDSNTLYQYKNLSERERIKSDVTEFRILSGEPVALWQSQDGEERTYGVKWGEDEQRLREFAGISDAAFSEESQMLLFQGSQEGESSESLYFCGKDQEPVEAYSDIAGFCYADNLNLLYYLTSDGSIYQVKLPVFDAETVADSRELKAGIKALEKLKLSLDAKSMGLSPNGEHFAWISSDGELHYLYFQADKDVVLGEQMAELKIFDQSLAGFREDGQMMRYVCHQGEMLNVKNSREGSAGTRHISTLFGDSLAVIDEVAGNLQVLDRNNGQATLVPDMTVYDKVMVQGEKVYGKNMEYSQVLGHWKLKEKNVILTFKPDNTLTVYESPDLTHSVISDGEESTISLNPLGITKFCLEPGASEEMTLDGDGWTLLTQSSSITIGEDNIFYWSSSKGEEMLPLEPVTEGQIQTLRRNVELALNYEAEAEERSQYIAAERERAEERRREEERKRQEEARKRQEEQRARDNLLQKAKNYYYNDIYLPSRTYYYSSPNMNSRTSRYLSKGTKKTVYQYQVDYNNNLIWLKIKGSDGNYYWVYTR